MGTDTDERRWVGALLVLTASMGMLDAIGLLHLGTFTGYMTGTVILAGVSAAHGTALNAPPFVALATLLIGAVLGGRLVRRRFPRPRLVADLLFAVAGLVALTAALDTFGAGGSKSLVAGLLGFAMGLQTSATRHAAVTDMTMPAATMALHGLAHDSVLAGGSGARSWRRFGIFAALLGGAALGALLSSRHVWLGLAACAALILLTAAYLRRSSTA